jgi:hypothetical protein
VDHLVDVVHADLAVAVARERLVDAVDESRELELVIARDALARCPPFAETCVRAIASAPPWTWAKSSRPRHSDIRTSPPPESTPLVSERPAARRQV